MPEFKEIIKKILRFRITQTIKKYNKESNSTQSKQGQIALIQNKVFEQAIKIMGDAIDDMDKEIEQKDYKVEFLENKLGLPECKDIEEMNRLGLNKISSKKCEKITDRLKKSLINHKYIKN